MVIERTKAEVNVSPSCALICIINKENFDGLSNFVPATTHGGKVVTVYGIRAVEQ